MEMTRKTRSQRADDLLRRIVNGPHIRDNPEGVAAYHRWMRSWILDDVVTLIPELQKQFGGKDGVNAGRYICPSKLEGLSRTVHDDGRERPADPVR